jgi:hypothetical protein
VKPVVLIDPKGDRIELYDWVHIPRFKAASRDQMTYAREDIERALMLRFGALTKQGYAVAEVEPIGRAAIDVPEEALEKGVEPLVVRKLDSFERKAVAELEAFERRGLVAMPSTDEQAMAEHVPALHRYVLGRGIRTLVVEGNPGRDLRQIVPEATRTPPHRTWMRAWLDAVSAQPGAIETLCLRTCRLHDFDLVDCLRPFPHVAFVHGFPRDLRCAAHAKQLTLGLYDPVAAIPDEAITGIDEAVHLERISLELARGQQNVESKLLTALCRTRLPALRELAVTGVFATTIVKALVDSPVLATLKVLRVHTRASRHDLAYLVGVAAAFGHLERFELRLLPGSDDAVPIPGVSTTTAYAMPICPF